MNSLQNTGTFFCIGGRGLDLYFVVWTKVSYAILILEKTDSAPGWDQSGLIENLFIASVITAFTRDFLKPTAFMNHVNHSLA